jgi:beta-glucosidase
MDSWLAQVPAVVEAWYSGMEGGNALARILFGDVSPSGKLPCTFPKRLEDTPAFAGGARAYPGENGTEHYDEGLLVGYRWYDTRNIEPLFPFGYGLSYTTFQYSDLKVIAGADPQAAVATVEFNLTNTGAREGGEIAQVYVHQGKPGLARPNKELKGFCKVFLKPGEQQTISIPLPRSAFAYYDPAKGGWLAEQDDFQILVGASSRDIRLQGVFRLQQTTLEK